MVIERISGGKPVFLSYLPAGSYVGGCMIDRGRHRDCARGDPIEGSGGRRGLRGSDAMPSPGRFARKMASRIPNSFSSAQDCFAGVVEITPRSRFLARMGREAPHDVF